MTNTTHAVWYAAAGCLADSDTPEFVGTLAECEAWIDDNAADYERPDVEHDTYGLSVSEYDADDTLDIDAIDELAESIGAPADALRAWCDNHHIERLADFDMSHWIDSYVGCYDDGILGLAEEIIQGWLDEFGIDWSHQLSSYIDAESLANDLQCEGFWSTNGHVFRPA